MELTLRDVGKIIKKSWILIVVLTVAGTIVGYGVSTYVFKKEYRATAMMIVSTTLQNQEMPSTTMTLNDYNLNAKLVNSYSVLAKSDRVLSQVREQLGINIDLDNLSSMISVSAKEDTDIISIAVTSSSPEVAQSIANTLVDVFKNEVTEIMKMDNVQVIDYAVLPDEPISPNIMINTTIGGVAGLIAALILALIRYIVDDTIKDTDSIMEIMDTPVIGNVPKLEQ
jgi:capsular polysaccharide biosynthesis protein